MNNNKCCCYCGQANNTLNRPEILLGAIIVNLEQLQEKENAILNAVRALKQQNVDLANQVAALQNAELPAGIADTTNAILDELK